MADVIVVGGGHNGLVAAATLAKAGRRVQVLEAREDVGGICHLLMDGSTLSPEVVKSLGLSTSAELASKAVNHEGRAINLDASAGDAGYTGWRSWVDTVRPALAAQLDAAAPDIGSTAPIWPLAKAGMAVRKLGKRDMMELLRVAPSCIDDWLSEHLTDPLLRAALMMPALQGTWMGPRSPTSAAALLLREACRAGTSVSTGSLPEALLAACKAAGVEVTTGATVKRIRIEGGKVAGVELADGTPVDAPTVLSTVGPKATFLRLLHPRHVPGKTAHQMEVVRVRGTLARIELDAATEVSWPGQHFFVANEPMHLERAFDDVKHRRLPTVPPPLEVGVGLFGEHVSVNCWSAPYELKGGWTDEAKDALVASVLESLEKAVPGAKDAKVVGVKTPADLETEFGLDGGHPNHGEIALDQLGPMRPSMKLSRYGTAIPGLWLGCAGIHPGGGISGRPGLFAAQAMLRG
ncbi:MAG: NAD(P)/FAD-dependent oxidoreductase [Deltaproteobacteria bacterium]|nr:NAD(P)/FAD-dependent oxidoreductase [Deltaproteobacteria bacterium]